MRRTAESISPWDQTDAVLEANAISHAFARPALGDVDLCARPGEVHALLGPNGAGKTTLLRVLCGLLQPAQGSLRVAGVDGIRDPLGIRKHIGLMPSGDGTLYRRLSAFENLVFFARLHGFRKRDAASRAATLLALVGLQEHADKRVYAYSHGMQKRLAFARALLSDPTILLIDEATHDLDPEAARLVRELTLAAANSGTAVVWATQRLDEIRGFAHVVTMLNGGRVCFSGSVTELVGRSVPSRYVLRLQNGGAPVSALTASLDRALGDAGTIAPAPRSTDEDFVLVLEPGHVIGDALPVFVRAGVRIVACREERSGLEEAFLALASGDAA